eukprot:TRINITY_DN5091_c1_g1_i4.p1 TRINITY_DN5091_c1_g1~~TRINITY_DN5091_c1_g1_i4.p1  ORF type:complete len:812 (+),score=400.78 TRINITY_DN5091_c1_g1_i4:161-2596(+)
MDLIRTIDSDEEIEYEDKEYSDPEDSEAEIELDEEDEGEDELEIDLTEFQKGDDEDDGTDSFLQVTKKKKSKKNEENIEKNEENDSESDTDIVKKEDGEDGEEVEVVGEDEGEKEGEESEEEKVNQRAEKQKKQFQKKVLQTQKNKKQKKKKADEEFDETFTFEQVEDSNPWDYSTAKAAFGNAPDNGIDSKINKILSQRKREFPLVEVKEEEEENDEEEEEENEEASGEESREEEEEKPAKKVKSETKIKKEEIDEEEEEEIVKDFYKRVDERGEEDEDEELEWESMTLSAPVMKAIKSLHYSTPTPIQSKGIPVAMAGNDIVGSAATGSGKTAAFVVPILEKLLRNRGRGIRALVILPSRELALQCHAVIEKLSQYTELNCVAIVGGLSVQSQETLLKQKPDIVVCTPGRMIDHLRNTASVSLDDVKFLVLDEADRLLDMGFKEELEELIKMCPKSRHTQLYSATMTEQVDKLVRLSLKNPIRIAVSDKLNVAEKLAQEFVKIKAGMELNRDAILLAICQRSVKSHCVIFVSKKVTAHRLKIVFGLSGLKASELHGNLAQTQRLESLEDFRDGRTQFLIATDLAARGLDIQGIQTVINFEMPRNMVEYVHRVGRTARAGGEGKSISFAGDDDKALVKRIIRKARDTVKQRIVPEDEIERTMELIASMEADVKQIIKEEKIDKVMAIADMEANKALNIMEHGDTIKSRPARTWFLTEREKKTKAKELKKNFRGKEEQNEDVDETGQTRSESKSNKRKREEPKVTEDFIQYLHSILLTILHFPTETSQEKVETRDQKREIWSSWKCSCQHV